MSAPLPLNEERHDGPWTLAHRVSAGYMEPTFDVLGRVTTIATWADASKAVKWREVLLTYTGIGAVSTVTEKQYDSAGVLVATRTRTVSFDPASGALASVDG